MTDNFELIDRVYRRLVSLILCDGEIGNGRFAQLFTNSTGEIAILAIESAEWFNLNCHAGVLREAVDLFPGGFTTDHEERLGRWEAIDEEAGAALDDRLGALDERWYALGDELERRLADFASRTDTTT
jgi:hypothetical protein